MTKIFERTRGLTENETHYCPGCTHGIIHRLVAEVLDELDLLDNAIGSRGDVKVHYIPANDLALECGSKQVANMIMLGAYLAISRITSSDSIIEAFKKDFGKKARKLIPLNIEALRRGMESVPANMALPQLN